MDLIGEFHPPTSHGNCYALTAVCMLTGFTWCIYTTENKDSRKSSKSIVRSHAQLIWRKFQNTDGQWTEFKNKLQESHQQTGHGFLHTFTTIQTTEQWED